MRLSPDETVGLIGAIGLGCAAFYAFCKWLSATPRTPDPWEPEVEQAVQNEEAIAVCPHCLTPQAHTGWFCPGCGSVSGQYGNYLPSVYIFSIGEAVRVGVEQPNRWRALVTTGYVLIALGFFSVLAPVYCFFLFINPSRSRGRAQSETSAAERVT
jgi:hypothetical protein